MARVARGQRPEWPCNVNNGVMYRSMLKILYCKECCVWQNTNKLFPKKKTKKITITMLLSSIVNNMELWMEIFSADFLLKELLFLERFYEIISNMITKSMP